MSPEECADILIGAQRSIGQVRIEAAAHLRRISGLEREVQARDQREAHIGREWDAVLEKAAALVRENADYRSALRTIAANWPDTAGGIAAAALAGAVDEPDA
jgi:hypothetical protein